MFGVGFSANRSRVIWQATWAGMRRLRPAGSAYTGCGKLAMSHSQQCGLRRGLQILSTAMLLLIHSESRGGGGAEGNRTPDLLIANEALSQLSYSPAVRRRTMLRRLFRVKRGCTPG